jgi:hypothetical protein
MAIQIIVEKESRLAIYGNTGTIVDGVDSNNITFAEAEAEWGLPDDGWAKEWCEAITFADDYNFPADFNCGGSWTITGTEGNYSFAQV